MKKGPKACFKQSTLYEKQNLLVKAGLENNTGLFIFTNGSWIRASENFHLLARQDK